MTNTAKGSVLKAPRRYGVAALAGLMLTVTVIAPAAIASSPTGTSAKSRRCAAFSYHHNSAGGTYRFSKLRITGAKCATIRKVVTGYFKDRGKPAGSVPSDGYDVYGWNVLIHTTTLGGYRRGARFSGVYDYIQD